MLRLYWYGLKLKPTRMIGESPKRGWVVCSSHPIYSITWTWAIYWHKPNVSYWKHNGYIKSMLKYVIRLGFNLHTQKAMIKKEYL